jgi:hypothetical protein
MKIIVTPHDLIERCVWLDYDYYILKGMSAEEKNTLITENKEFEISERDALVIGLLKTMYTDNLVHRVNQYILSALESKSIMHEGKEIVQVDHLMYYLRKFMRKFPNAYVPDALWTKLIEEARVYVEHLKLKFAKLKAIEIDHGTASYQFVNVKSVKKALDKHHG